MDATFDTNILIDYLRGFSEAREEIARYEKTYVSVITWMEVFAGAKNRTEEKVILEFLERFVVVSLTEAIAFSAVAVRRKLKVKLPDAIVLATARELKTILVTRNIKDFDQKNPEIRVPYKIE